MKTTNTLLLIMLLQLTSIAQRNEQAFDWTYHVKGGVNNIEQLTHDYQDNVWVLGNSNMKGLWGSSPIPTTPKFGNFPGTGFFVGKITKGGTQSLVITFSAMGSLKPSKIGFDNVGNIYVAGTSDASVASPVNFGNNVTLSAEGYFVAKFNHQGVAQWAKLLNMDMASWQGFTGVSGFKVMQDGKMYIAMYNPNSYTTTAPFSYQFWLMKLDEMGNELWRKTHTSASQTSVASFLPLSNEWVDDNGNVCVYHYSFGDKKINLGTDTSEFVGNPSNITHLFTFNADGNTIWKGAFAGSGEFSVAPNGHITAFWRTAQSALNTAPPFGNLNTSPIIPNYFSGFVRFTMQGQQLAHKGILLNADTVSNVSPETFVVLPNGGVIVNAQANTTMAVKFDEQTLPNGNYSIYAEYDSVYAPKNLIAFNMNQPSKGLLSVKGNKVAIANSFSLAQDSILTINNKQHFACENDYGYRQEFPVFASVMADVLIGQWDRSLQGGTDTTSGGGDTTTSVLTMQNSPQVVSIYPNPSKGIIDLNLPSNQIQHIIITDINGKNLEYNQGTNTIALPDFLTNGLYFLHIITQQNTHYYLRFMLQR